MNTPAYIPSAALQAKAGVSALFFAHCMRIGGQLGFPTQVLLDKAHVTEAELQPADGWVRQDVLERLTLSALDHWQDPLMALRMAMAMEPAMAGVLGYMMQCCPSLLDMHNIIVEFGQLALGVSTWSLTHEPGAALWGVHMNSTVEPYVRQSEEALLGASAVLIRRQNPLALREVHFTHSPALAGGKPHPFYHKIFGCPVLFNQPRSVLVLHPQSLNSKLPYGDPVIFEALRQQARVMAQQFLAEPRLEDRVKEALRKLLAQGVSSREAVAESLGMSARHLGRQLQAQGSHYQSILDELRSELARQYLAQPECDLEDVAARLGFSGASSFSRWFRAEMGVTVAEFRRGSV